MQRLRDFFHFDFCDNYMEFIKYRAYGNKKEDKDAVAYTIFTVAFEIINLLSPIMPFVCEHIYQTNLKKYLAGKTIVAYDWPSVSTISKKDLETGEFLKQIISAVKKYKSQKELSLKSELENLTIITDKDKIPAKIEKEVKQIMFIKKIVWEKGNSVEAK